MKIVHTSDWHAGRLWKGLNRLDELEECLDHLAGFIRAEKVDLLLMTGDIFDTGAPAARAERSVFQFFKQIGECGTHAVVIAGNHDSGDRVEAWSLLTELINVRALGRPKPVRQGGLMEIRVRSGETALVAAVPFAAQRRLVSAAELAEGEETAMQTYAEKMARIVNGLCSHFRSNTVNLLCLHTHLDGATVAASDISERKVHLGDEWAAMPGTLPFTAHYIAGHIHKPQRIAAPSPAYYACSPLQLDFGEAAEEKSFVVVGATPGPTPARIATVPYKGGRQLMKIRATLQQLESRAEELRHAGWLKVIVPLDMPDSDINRKVRMLLPGTVKRDGRFSPAD